MKTLLLDVGGTFIKCSDGREIPVSSDGSREEISASFAEAVGGFCRDAEAGRDGAPGSADSAARDGASCNGGSSTNKTVTDGEKEKQHCGIAVAIPGPFDYERGIFLMRHKFSAVYGESFRKLAGVPEGVELRFIHDVNVMLAGEMSDGNGRGFSRAALVALGTGLGFAMSIDGHILKKETGTPLVSIFGLPYRDGILEDYASKRGFLRTFRDFGGQGAGTVKEMAALASGGDEAAAEAFRRVGETIAGAISPILKEYEIECLLFGGQISRSFSLMESSVREGLSDVACLRSISPVSDFDNATFNGLRGLFRSAF